MNITVRVWYPMIHARLLGTESKQPCIRTLWLWSLFFSILRARTVRNLLVLYLYKSRTLCGAHRKRTTVKGDWPQVLNYIRRAQKTLISSKIDFKCRSHRNLTRQVSMTCRTLIGALKKRTCQLRLTKSLVLYSARTENAHVLEETS